MTSYDQRLGQRAYLQSVTDDKTVNSIRNQSNGSYQAEPSVYTIGVWMVLMPMGFDFKDRGVLANSFVFQFLIFSTSVIGFLILNWAVFDRNRKTFDLTKAKSYFYLWTFYFVFIFIITVLRGVNFYQP